MQTKAFPYIKSLQINNCFSAKDLEVKIFSGTEPRHLILTGKNGSGKSTILNCIDTVLNEWMHGKNPQIKIATLKSELQKKRSQLQIQKSKSELQMYAGVDLSFTSLHPDLFPEGYGLRETFSDTLAYIYVFFKAFRKTALQNVESVTKQDTITQEARKQTSHECYVNVLKQFLVNKKVNQAFSILEDNTSEVRYHEEFFENLTLNLRRVFGDDYLKLEFERNAFEFYLKFSDQRRVTLNQLSDGYSAFITMLMDLAMRTNLIQNEIGNYGQSPSGIVLIDEPETHLHLEMQYQVLPMLTSLYPNLQFIIASHSPAVISSIKNCTIYDLSTQKSVTHEYVSKSYSELMVTHFGLDNEYSPIARDIILKANNIIQNSGTPEILTTKLVQFMDENKELISPSLHLELESCIEMKRRELQK